MRILFIGGTGNISAECADLLHKAGHEIAIIGRGRRPVPPQFKTVIADRNDLPAMRRAVDHCQPEVVLNFLGYELQQVQLDHSVFAGKIRQYVFISSASVYSKPPPSLPIHEDSPLGNPWWDYSQKKQLCEEWLLERWRTQGFPVTIVRPSHTYSRRWIPNAISSSSYTFAARLEAGAPVFIHDDGRGLWTLTASSDFAVGLAGLLAHPQALGQAFHITSDEILSWRQIYSQIAEALGVSDPQFVGIPTDFICQAAPRFTGTLLGDKAHPGVFDNAKIKRFVPAFVCRKTFATGVRESVEYLRAHPEEQNRSDELNAAVQEVLDKWAQRSTW